MSATMSSSARMKNTKHNKTAFSVIFLSSLGHTHKKKRNKQNMKSKEIEKFSSCTTTIEVPSRENGIRLLICYLFTSSFYEALFLPKNQHTAYLWLMFEKLNQLLKEILMGWFPAFFVFLTFFKQWMRLALSRSSCVFLFILWWSQTNLHRIL